MRPSSPRRRAWAQAALERIGVAPCRASSRAAASLHPSNQATKPLLYLALTRAGPSVLCRLPAARGSGKADAVAELRPWLEALLEDLAAALPAPEWPGAALLLRRLGALLPSEAGLRSGEAGTR